MLYSWCKCAGRCRDHTIDRLGTLFQVAIVILVPAILAVYRTGRSPIGGAPATGTASSVATVDSEIERLPAPNEPEITGQDLRFIG